MTQTAHASGLNSVARELASLHRNMLTSGRDGDGIIRLSVLTLVAICSDRESAALVEEAVRHISFSHPARAIIIVADPLREQALEADLSLISAPGRGGRICAEQVRLTAGGEPARHLASLVIPLLLPDVPVYVWMVGHRSLDGELESDAISLGAPLIVDSGSHKEPAEGLAAVAGARERHPDLVLADIAWARSRSWREHIAAAFNGAQARPFVRSINRIEVESVGSTPSAQAWLTAGWLTGRLSQDQGGGPEPVVTASPGVDVPDGDLRAVRLFATTGAHRAAVAVELAEGRITTRVHVDGGVVQHRAMPFVSVNVVRVVGSLLEQTADDPVYTDSLRLACQLSSAAQ